MKDLLATNHCSTPNTTRQSRYAAIVAKEVSNKQWNQRLGRRPTALDRRSSYQPSTRDLRLGTSNSITLSTMLSHLRQFSSLTVSRSLRGSSHAATLLHHNFFLPAQALAPATRLPPISSSVGSATTARGFSSAAGGLRSAAPNYTVFGEKAMLNVRVMLPGFRLSSGNYLIQDNNRKGRILLEWTPRIEVGGFNRDNQIRFGLSAEEVGFLLHQLPNHQVEFARKIGSYASSTPGQIADDLPDKVMRITPKEGGQFSLYVDFEKDGVGGQSPDLNAPALGPLEVTAQLGEWQVMQHLMKASIPALVGWDAQLRIAVQNSIEAAYHSGGPSGPGPSAF